MPGWNGSIQPVETVETLVRPRRTGRWEMERDLIFKTLARVVENRTHAAKELGISIRTLRNKLREYRDLGYQVEAENPDVSFARCWAKIFPLGRICPVP